MRGVLKRGRAAGLPVMAAMCAALAFGLATAPGRAAEKDLTDKGEVLVKENCSRCHAIGKEGDSPHPEAPPFRTLSSRYPIEDLAESLAEGIVSGHPDMPIFVFSPADVEAIIDYLNSIQEQPAPKQPTEPD
jgi:cytochrome c